MIKVSKGKLKAEMLAYFRRVESTGEELIVTDHRVPVLRVVPIRKSRSSEEIFAKYRGRLSYSGILTEPTTDEWPQLK